MSPTMQLVTFGESPRDEEGLLFQAVTWPNGRCLAFTLKIYIDFAPLTYEGSVYIEAALNVILWRYLGGKGEAKSH